MGFTTSILPSSSPPDVAPNITCTELIRTIVPTVCSNNVMSTLADSRKAAVQVAVQASEHASKAAHWELAMVTLVLASLVVNHGRFIAWIGLSLILLSMQLLYVGWQLLMIAVTMLMYSTLTYASVVFYIGESVRRWTRGRRAP